MTSAIDDSAMSVPARVWRFLRGPRFIDLPIRLLALIMSLTILVPGAFEIVEPRYATFLVVAYALILLAAFVPLTTVIASTGLGILFSPLYPDLENMFPEALLLATAVLISRRRWIGFSVGTAGLGGYLGLSTWVGSYDAGFEGFTDLGYGWLTYSLLGLCASFVEARISREIDRRERAAVDHQRSLDAMRARFTSDMHDTISHSLTTESAIIRTLAKETDPAHADRLLAELALVNAEATKRLRQLVRSLSTWEAETSSAGTRDARIRFRAEAEQLTSAIEDGCAAGSVPLNVQLAWLPSYSSSTLARHFRAILLELATNVIRYSTPDTPASLTVEIRGESGDRAELVCRSTNDSPTELTVVPRSLSSRATAVGGTCEVGSDEAKRTIVEVALPVRFMSPTATADTADRADTTEKVETSEKAETSEMIDVIDPRSDATSDTRSDATSDTRLGATAETRSATTGGTDRETGRRPATATGPTTSGTVPARTESRDDHDKVDV